MDARPTLANILSSNEEQISCFDIEVFQLNHRRSKNPQYEEIKQSIRHIGLKEPIHIVFHPNTKRWTLSQGGQTRLKICQELYDECQDDMYLYPPTIKNKYISDLDLCVNHLVENNLRGENTFLETAYAVINIRKILENERGIEITQEVLADEMSKRGMPIRRQSISSMYYLGETIAPKISNQLFLDTVSRNIVDSIRGLRNKLKSIIPVNQFDKDLIEFLNNLSTCPTINLITEHFAIQSNNRDISEKNTKLANKLSNAIGMGDVVEATESLSSGFIVIIPEKVDSKEEAEFYYWLSSLSGIFEKCPLNVLRHAGLSNNSDDPNQLAVELRERLNIEETEIHGLATRILCQADDKAFITIKKLIEGIREGFNSKQVIWETQ